MTDTDVKFNKGDMVRYHGRMPGSYKECIGKLAKVLDDSYYSSTRVMFEGGAIHCFDTRNFELVQSEIATDQQLASRAKEIWKEYYEICKELHSRGFDRYHGTTVANQAKAPFKLSEGPSWKKVITEEVIL